MADMEFINVYSFLIYSIGCRPLSSQITSSNDNNCSNTTTHTTTSKTITRICMEQLDLFLRRARSHQTLWPCKWHQTTPPCINRTPSFSRRQMASTWTCISLSAAHATCLTESTGEEIIISSTELTPITTLCCLPPANVHRSWINSRTTAKFHRNSQTHSRHCKLHPRAPTLQMAVLMSPSGLHHQTTLISRLNSKTAANYWTAWIRSTTTTLIRPISIIFWSEPIKLREAKNLFYMLYELTKKNFFLIRIFILILMTLKSLFVLGFMSVIFLYMCIYLLRKKPSNFLIFVRKKILFFILNHSLIQMRLIISRLRQKNHFKLSEQNKKYTGAVKLCTKKYFLELKSFVQY